MQERRSDASPRRDEPKVGHPRGGGEDARTSGTPKAPFVVPTLVRLGDVTAITQGDLTFSV